MKARTGVTDLPTEDRNGKEGESEGVRGGTKRKTHHGAGQSAGGSQELFKVKLQDRCTHAKSRSRSLWGKC